MTIAAEIGPDALGNATLGPPDTAIPNHVPLTAHKRKAIAAAIAVVCQPRRDP